MFLSESEPHMDFPAWKETTHTMSIHDMERMAVKDGFPGGPEEALENLWTWFQKTHGKKNRIFQPIFWPSSSFSFLFAILSERNPTAFSSIL